MALITSWPMVRIRHRRIGGCRTIDKRRHVGCRLHARPDYGSAAGVPHQCGNTASYPARLAEEAAEQSAQRIDDTHFGRVYGLGRKAAVSQSTCIVDQALLNLVYRSVRVVRRCHDVLPLSK